MKDSKPFITIQTIVIIIIFSALSAVGGLLKIPSPIGSIAFDSAPGYFCAAYFSPLIGAIIGAAGHLSSALTAGFPLGLNHLYVAFHMLLWCFCFGQLAQLIGGARGLIIASTVAIILNGAVSPLLLTISPFQPMPMKIAIGLIGFLILASSANVIVAALAYRAISKLRISGL
ncbi:MAG TPA: alpha-ribazole transporter [Verrucomicrobiota bacterium]|nr:alpha-ribazole transporter [Verrucomicrobiota bacterium]